MSYRLTLAAERDLDGLYIDGFDRFGQRAADHDSERLVRVRELLGRNPRTARERSEFSPPLRAHPIGVHVILYRIEGESILVLRIRHGREDWQAD